MAIKKIPIFILLRIAAIWIASDIGYYLLPLFGFHVDYNDHPIWISLYYTFWLLLSVIVFWPTLSKWRPVKNYAFAGIISVVLFATLVLFAYFIMPGLPSIIWTESWDPPELMVANPWYFLPKAAEILLQQLLISVLVLALRERSYSINAISVGCMILFGGAHFFLAFNELPIQYTIRFIISATAFGFLFPRIILTIPNGFLYSYALHWLYYVITIVMAHTVSPYAP